MLNKRTRYAIKALMHIAKEASEESPMSGSAIAELSNIPYKFLEAILNDLKNGGYIVSRKGVNGGYFMAQNPSKIYLTSIIRAINGPIALVPCVSLNYYEQCDFCENEERCALHETMKEVRDASLAILDGTSIQQLIERENR